MTITENDTFLVPVGHSRISREGFRQMMLQRAAPAVLAERDPAAYYDAAATVTTADGKRQVDALLLAAKFQHESVMGRAGVAVITHSWGNTRTPNFGAQPVGETPGRTGTFPIWRDWLDGMKSTAARLTTEQYVYNGVSVNDTTHVSYPARRTIREIYDHPSEKVWAPAGDLNDPSGYLRAVLDFMNRYADGGTDMAVDISRYVPPRIVQQWFEPNGKSYLGEDMEMWGVCIHETGNTNAGAEAQQNRNYMASAECVNREASWHSTVGRDIIIEGIPRTKQAFHASDGSGPGNTHFFAIEGVMCYPVGTPDFRRVMTNHAWYAAKILRAAGLPCVPVAPDADYTQGKTLAQHNDFARDHKDCPQFYRDHNLWLEFGALAQAFWQRNEWAMPPVTPATNPLYFPQTDHYIDPAFWDFWNQHGGVEDFGFPVTGSHMADVVVNDLTGETKNLLVQYFERAVFQLHADGIKLRRLGAEEAARAGFSGPGIPKAEAA